MKKIDKLRDEFNNMGLINYFELETIHKKTREDEVIPFHIEFIKNSLVATHPALTEKESRSKKIATKKVVVDPDFSLTDNLHALLDICNDAINESDFFTLK